MYALSSWQLNGLAFLRMITGALALYHGIELFDQSTMNEYLNWEVFKQLPMPALVVYTGKALEVVAGLSLLLGFFTRTGGIILCMAMLFICFKVGQGKFWYEDQHPFLFAMLGLVYFFAGPVKWSIDKSTTQ